GGRWLQGILRRFFGKRFGPLYKIGSGGRKAYLQRRHQRPQGRQDILLCRNGLYSRRQRIRLQSGDHLQGAGSAGQDGRSSGRIGRWDRQPGWTIRRWERRPTWTII